MSRDWIFIFTFRCPEVGSYFVTFVVVAAAAVSVVILELPHRLVLVDPECSDDATLYFSLGALSVNSREELVVVCSACRFQIVTLTSRHDG